MVVADTLTKEMILEAEHLLDAAPATPDEIAALKKRITTFEERVHLLQLDRAALEECKTLTQQGPDLGNYNQILEMLKQIFIREQAHHVPHELRHDITALEQTIRAGGLSEAQALTVTLLEKFHQTLRVQETYDLRPIEQRLAELKATLSKPSSPVSSGAQASGQNIKPQSTATTEATLPGFVKPFVKPADSLTGKTYATLFVEQKEIIQRLLDELDETKTKLENLQTSQAQETIKRLDEQRNMLEQAFGSLQSINEANKDSWVSEMQKNPQASIKDMYERNKALLREAQEFLFLGKKVMGSYEEEKTVLSDEEAWLTVRNQIYALENEYSSFIHSSPPKHEQVAMDALSASAWLSETAKNFEQLNDENATAWIRDVLPALPPPGQGDRIEHYQNVLKESREKLEQLQQQQKELDNAPSISANPAQTPTQDTASRLEKLKDLKDRYRALKQTIDQKASAKGTTSEGFLAAVPGFTQNPHAQFLAYYTKLTTSNLEDIPDQAVEKILESETALMKIENYVASQ